MAGFVKVENLPIEHARLIFRNFKGEPDSVNPSGGVIKFGVIIDPEIYDIDRLREVGWVIKELKPRTEDGDSLYYLSVKVQFGKGKDPDVKLICDNVSKNLREDTIGCLDTAELLNVDLVIHPYCWNVGDKSGVKAYLEIGYFTIKQNDPFAEKYAFLNS